MDDKQRYIRILLKKLDVLEKKQNQFQAEISALREEIELLSTDGTLPETEATMPSSSSVSAMEEIQEELKKTASAAVTPPTEKERIPHTDTPKRSTAKTSFSSPSIPPKQKKTTPAKPKKKSDFEKFIGENLINKIGIIITVLGVSFGIKYAIDHDIISPMMRIVLAYAFGGGLVALAMYLKKNYISFSAVLLSGAMAIFYFTTYIAYDFYALIPQTATFVLMVMFTAFTVFAALNYNQQVIAHLGLLGAYAIPFLLSDGSGRVAILFSYMVVLNLGILTVSIFKYWKSLYYAAMGLTWLIFLSWWGDRYSFDQHFALAMGFALAFYLIFYVTLLCYKIIKKEKYNHLDILLVVLNSFIYYGVGFALIQDLENGPKLLGIFTLANAMLQFVVAIFLFYQKLADRSLFYLIAGMVLVFVTIAVPVQLDGNWVTFLWAAQAALLFWLGRSQRISIYEMFSYPLMLLAFGSLLHDWGTYKWGADVTPIFNITFFTSLTVAASFVLINWINIKHKLSENTSGMLRSSLLSVIAPIILLIVSYFAFYFEIANYFEQLYTSSGIDISEGEYSYKRYNSDITDLRVIWIFIYSMLYVSILSGINLLLVKGKRFALANLVFSTLVLIGFLTSGLYVLGELRSSYLTPNEMFATSFSQVSIRYLAIVFVAVVLLLVRLLVRKQLLPAAGKSFYDLLIHVPVIWLLSNEVINWMQLHQAEHSYKLEISILWGVYALFLIVLGIAQKKKYLRIGAIILFGITLAKLFLYDIAKMEAIGKTIVFVALGILLLIISFLYNKYKDKMNDDLDQGIEKE